MSHVREPCPGRAMSHVRGLVISYAVSLAVSESRAESRAEW